MTDKDIVFYHNYKLHFWGGSWDLYDKDGKYIIKCFRYLEDAKDYINKLEETTV